mmetsp:Transcript_14502/g.48044  ORF Transcript_14502/g.48044 Transcript_14502/m.48044 type:complete len:226 (-) Transcript_14502:65-742(-)
MSAFVYDTLHMWYIIFYLCVRHGQSKFKHVLWQCARGLCPYSPTSRKPPPPKKFQTLPSSRVCLGCSQTLGSHAIVAAACPPSQQPPALRVPLGARRALAVRRAAGEEDDRLVRQVRLDLDAVLLEVDDEAQLLGGGPVLHHHRRVPLREAVLVEEGRAHEAAHQRRVALRRPRDRLRPASVEVPLPHAPVRRQRVPSQCHHGRDVVLRNQVRSPGHLHERWNVV